MKSVVTDEPPKVRIHEIAEPPEEQTIPFKKLMSEIFPLNETPPALQQWDAAHVIL